MVTGYYPPGTVTQTSQSLLAWIGTGNVAQSNNAVATAALTVANPTSETLLATNFSLGVPLSVINGIETEIEIDQLDAQITLSAQLVKYGVVVGQARTTTSTGTIVLGGATDLWGITLTQVDARASSFGVALTAAYAGATLGTITIDRIRVRANYSGSLETLNFPRMVGTI